MAATIFVNIAAYRDPECEPTIRDLFEKAEHPENVTVGIVLQAAQEDQLYRFKDRVRCYYVNAKESRGACWARNRGYGLWDGEDYVLQIDAHMRFAEHWDTRMIAQLAQCDSDTPILTTYPGVYTTPPDTIVSKEPWYLTAARFEPHGCLIQVPIGFTRNPVRPKSTGLVGAGYIFGRSRWIKDVPYDPYLYFLGEEPTVAARLWTHGYDLFAPCDLLLWHQYRSAKDRFGRAFHVEDNTESHAFNMRAVARMRHLFGMEKVPPEAVIELEKYGLGAARSFAAYEKFVGIDFQRRLVSQRTKAGTFPRNANAYDMRVGEAKPQLPTPTRSVVA